MLQFENYSVRRYHELTRTDNLGGGLSGHLRTQVNVVSTTRVDPYQRSLLLRLLLLSAFPASMASASAILTHFYEESLRE